MKKQLWCLNLFVGCISESSVPCSKIQDMFHYSIKMSKIFFQPLLLLSLQSWHLHSVPESIQHILCAYTYAGLQKPQTQFLKSYKVYVCFLVISMLYSLSPALTNSLYTFNSLECNGLPVCQEWELGVYDVRVHHNSRQHSYAPEITVQHPYLLTVLYQSGNVLHFPI